jgi:hypothetical protein
MACISPQGFWKTCSRDFRHVQVVCLTADTLSCDLHLCMYSGRTQFIVTLFQVHYLRIGPTRICHWNTYHNLWDGGIPNRIYSFYGLLYSVVVCSVTVPLHVCINCIAFPCVPWSAHAWCILLCRAMVSCTISDISLVYMIYIYIYVYNPSAFTFIFCKFVFRTICNMFPTLRWCVFVCVRACTCAFVWLCVCVFGWSDQWWNIWTCYLRGVQSIFKSTLHPPYLPLKAI